MKRKRNLRGVRGGSAAALGLCLALALGAAVDARDRLSEPFLQNPGPTSVSVVWFTEAKGRAHEVRVGPEQRVAAAESRRLQSLFEDAASRLPKGHPLADLSDPAPRRRPVWRHEARIDGLTPGESLRYFVVDVDETGETRASDVHRLQPAPPPGQPLTILLTSDHQAKPMAAANIRKVSEIAPRIDAIFFAGDLVNVPARASEWFDDADGASFFDVLQGRATYHLETRGPSGRRSVLYRGAPLLQSAPLFPALGNHEVMGRFDLRAPLNEQYHNPKPRRVAERWYLLVEHLLNPLGDPGLRERWIQDASHNARAYRDIFSLPDDAPGGERYYFKRFGDVALVSLLAARIWRPMTPRFGRGGRYAEARADLARPDAWGHGALVFEPIGRGSDQYAWLERTLRSEAFRSAPIKLVMMHHPPRGLGDNVATPFATPQPDFVRDARGAPTAVRYRYPKDANPLIRDLEPLFIEHGVDLVFFGHSHLWQRLRLPGGPHYLESSNVGNTYGCYFGERRRRGAPFDLENFTLGGDPYGLAPRAPSLFAPQRDETSGAPLPCVASNEMTVFTLLDTAARAVESYVYDTNDPDAPPRLFDRFVLD
ncbi:MAG: metallophosphoesterase [Pseudomonadota bacterium]